jgi:hypothetical protein
LIFWLFLVIVPVISTLVVGDTNALIILPLVKVGVGVNVIIAVGATYGENASVAVELVFV